MMEDYKYYLLFNDIETEVIEPIGWDTFESKLVRNEDYHGVSAEYSEVMVKFFEPVAMDLIKAAYEEDIDNIVTFISRYKGVEEYRGQLEFGVYKEGHEDSRYIQVTIAEIDIRVKFKSRFETKVDLDSLTAFDGATLPKYPHLNYSLIMPSKGIRIIGDTNLDENTKPNYSFSISTGNEVNDFVIPFGDINLNEISTLTPKNQWIRYREQPIITHDTVFTNEFDADSVLECNDGKYTIDVSGEFTMEYKGGTKPTRFWIDFLIYKISGNSSQLMRLVTIYDKNGDIPDIFTFNLDTISSLSDIELEIGDKITVFIQPDGTGFSATNPLSLELIANKASFSISSLSKCQATTADAAFLHEAFSRIAESVTNGSVTVKSETYGREDSDVNPATGTNTFAISNGLRIRKYIDTGGNKPILSLSFKELLEGFIPIHNIGYGFVKENGKFYLRVEKYEWFYKDDVIFSINNPKKKIRSVVPKEVFANFKVGYKKYETDGTNGLDSIASEREYRTRQILTDTKLEKISTLVSDSYAIEYTRRRANDKNTENWTYDNDLFVINIQKVYNSFYYPVIGNIEADNLISPESLYNAAISPARCATNWLGRLFGWSHKQEELIFTSGTGNINASIKITDETNAIEENQSFPSGTPVFNHESMEIPEHPILPSEFRKIKNNPYGIIEVDGEQFYIKEVKYKRRSSMASFTLLPKY